VNADIPGDGLKLHRDFPNAFPLGLTNLLELTYVARKVDPIGTGPGSGLISLANLCLEYTGKQLKKENDVRKSNWIADLNDDQKDCECSCSSQLTSTWRFIKLIYKTQQMTYIPVCRSTSP
jgi:hypothetical protein